MATIENLRSWMERDLSRFGKLQEHTLECELSATKTERRYTVAIYTDANRYAIHAVERTSHAKYLGCIASSRKPRAGEDCHRGRDLADGPLSEETWRRILADIVSYEMVRVHHPADWMLKPGERTYPPAEAPTRLTTGAEPPSQTERASRADPSS